MKKRILAFALLVAMASLLPAAEKFKMTLSQAHAYALQQNPTLGMARANIAAAAAAIKYAKSAYYPTVDVTAGYSRIRDSRDGKSRAYYDETGLDTYRDYKNTDKYGVGLSVNWVAFDGGARYFNKLISELGSEIAINACDDAKRVLLENVSYAFFAVMRAQSSMNIALQDAEFNRILHKDSKTRLENGVAKPSEVLNFEFQVGKAEVDFISAEENWRNACVALGRLLVIEQNSIWEMIELIPPDDSRIKTQINEVPNDLVKYAFTHRPDLLSAERSVSRAAAAIKTVEANFMPKVNLFYDTNFERKDNAHFNSHFDREITFGAAMTWNLFNGFGTVAQKESAKAQLEYANKYLDDLKQQVEAEVRQNCIAVDSSRRTLEKEKKQYEIAKQIRDLVKEEYDGGTATITRLNEVQTDLTNAALAKSIAYISLLNSLEALNSSTGHIIVNETTK